MYFSIYFVGKERTLESGFKGNFIFCCCCCFCWLCCCYCCCCCCCCCFCWLCYCCCCCCCCFCFKNFFKSFLKKGYSIENNSTVHNISVTWHIWSEFDLIGRIYYVKVFHLLIFCLWHRISLRRYVLFFIFRKLKKRCFNAWAWYNLLFFYNGKCEVHKIGAHKI